MNPLILLLPFILAGCELFKKPEPKERCITMTFPICPEERVVDCDCYVDAGEPCSKGPHLDLPFDEYIDAGVKKDSFVTPEQPMRHGFRGIDKL